jgi:hypothetical protein
LQAGEAPKKEMSRAEKIEAMKKEKEAKEKANKKKDRSQIVLEVKPTDTEVGEYSWQGSLLVERGLGGVGSVHPLIRVFKTLPCLGASPTHMSSLSRMPAYLIILLADHRLCMTDLDALYVKIKADIQQSGLTCKSPPPPPSPKTTTKCRCTAS